MNRPVPSLDELLLLGVGTVFATLAIICLAMTGIALTIAPQVPFLREFGTFLLTYGGVGTVIASVICVVGAVPLVLLFRLLFTILQRSGVGLRKSAMGASGLVAFLGTIGVLAAGHIAQAIRVPAGAWAYALIPALIAMVLSARLTLQQDGEA